MKISGNMHLCYCLNNLRPFSAVSGDMQIIKTLKGVREKLGLCSSVPFAAGLWVNEKTLQSLEDRRLMPEFIRILHDNNIYVFTFNIFPYGEFHGGRIKEKVYSPDWRTDERLSYTCRAAKVLAELLPEGVTGSMSTLPGGYGQLVGTADSLERIAANLRRTALFLEGLYASTGKKIILAVEPEPDCLWECASDFADFFLQKLGGYKLCREFIGICYDSSHQELSGINPGEGIEICRSNGVKIAKVQLSAALGAPTPDSKNILAKFADDIYLHQTRAFSHGAKPARYNDLPDAIKTADKALYWKIHYHIPLYLDMLPGGLKTEKSELEAVLGGLLSEPAICPNIEIETYTFPVLPDEIKNMSLEDSMKEEYSYVLKKLRF